MTHGMQGANLEEMRHLARDLEAASQQLLTIRQELGQRIRHQLAWEGPDAFVFKHAWQSSYAPVMAAGASMLKETAVKLQRQAVEQETASA